MGPSDGPPRSRKLTMRSIYLSTVALAMMGPNVCFADNGDDGAGGGSAPQPPAPEDTTMREAIPNPVIIQDGQIALTARNNGDGTWAVTAGPGGKVLRDGLAREQAIAIVGAPTGPYDPATVGEGKLADQRLDVEQQLVDETHGTTLVTDEEAGAVDPRLANRSVTDPSTGEKVRSSTAGTRVIATGVPTYDAAQATASAEEVEDRKTATTTVIGGGAVTGEAKGNGEGEGSTKSKPRSKE